MHATGSHAGTAPARAKLVLISLILVAAVANLNLAVADGVPARHRQARSVPPSRGLDLVAVGYSSDRASRSVDVGDDDGDDDEWHEGERVGLEEDAREKDGCER